MIVAAGAEHFRAVLLPIAAQHVGQNGFLGFFLVRDTGLQVKLGQLLLRPCKLVRAKRYALVASFGGIVADAIVGGRAVALSEPPIADPVVSLAVLGHVSVPSFRD